MALYLDASALVKRYVSEKGSSQVHLLIKQSDEIGIGLIGRVEVAAALAKAKRMNVIDDDATETMLQQFSDDWERFVAIQTTDAVVQLAASYAWDHNLRGYDAVHLASAMVWKLASDQSVSFVTYDRRLWEAADQVGLTALPEDLPSVLAEWLK